MSTKCCGRSCHRSSECCRTSRSCNMLPCKAAKAWGSKLGQFGQGNPVQNFGAQFGVPQFQSAFGAPAAGGQQRQLTQQDVADVTRQLIGVIPQVIGNLQTLSQQRMILSLEDRASCRVAKKATAA